MNWFLGKGLQFIGSKLDGYKTKIGGVGLILTGLLGGITLIWPDAIPNAPVMTIDQIMTAVTAGFVAIGIGGKLDKNTAAVETGNVIFKETCAPAQTITSPELTAEQREVLTKY